MRHQSNTKFTAVLAAFMLAAVNCLGVAQEQGTAHGPPVSGQQEQLHAELAAADVRWIATRMGWAKQSVPTLETRSAAQLSTMFFGFPEGIDGIRPLALYSPSQHILYLSDQIMLVNLSDRSILLHELVHHLQILNDVQLECREEAEAQAYRLQIQWLREQGVRDPYALLGLSRDEIDTLRCP